MINDVQIKMLLGLGTGIHNKVGVRVDGWT